MNSEYEIDDNVCSRSRKFKEKPPLWDSFQDPPTKRASGSAANWTKLSIVLKFFKVFIYLFVFAINLLTSSISKLSYIFMVAHIKVNRNITYCNIIDVKGKYYAELPPKEQLVWIWSLIFAFSVPEIFTFLRSIRICIFKDVKSPKWPEVLLMMDIQLERTPNSKRNKDKN